MAVVLEMDSIYTNMINAIEYRNVKAMVSIWLHIHVVEIGNREIATADSSKLVYFVKCDGGSGAALQGDRGPSGSRGLQGDLLEVKVQL